MLISEADFEAPPEELFAAVCDRPGAFLLDSALPAGGLGAFSFLGFDPFLSFRAKGETITVRRRGGSEEVRRGDPLAALGELLRSCRRPGAPGLPFSGGAVGYLSYELCSRLERIPRTSPDDPEIPDLEFGFHDGVVAYEHATRKYRLIANAADPANEPAIIARLAQLGRTAPSPPPRPERAPGSPAARLVSNFTKAEYLGAIAKIKAYIAAGDVYQVNLSQRFAAPLAGHPFALYRRLRARSPAPFSSYLNCAALQLVSSSPERFLRIREGRLETRPIKGTRPRGGSPDEDARLRRELLASEKDRAELLMIVDLERNDLGRVCEPGSIRVDRLHELETHPTVHHLVAAVSGRMRADGDALGCIRAMFPGGSITGAPKIRAMQVIDELETCRRHAYTGALGYLGFDGGCDLSIAIRTIACAGGRAEFHAGGGIVWDSDPEAEYQETLDKARAMREALAESG